MRQMSADFLPHSPNKCTQVTRYNRVERELRFSFFLCVCQSSLNDRWNTVVGVAVLLLTRYHLKSPGLLMEVMSFFSQVTTTTCMPTSFIDHLWKIVVGQLPESPCRPHYTVSVSRSRTPQRVACACCPNKLVFACPRYTISSID